MSRFKKNNRRSVPSLNTASLPDLIFTLLFFFMIVTNMRNESPKVRFELPNASEINKLEEKNLILYIYIGKPLQAPSHEEENQLQIQINDDLVSPDNLKDHIEKIKNQLKPEDQPKLMAALEIDKHAKMGLVTRIKQILRETDVLTINYVAEKNDHQR